MEQIRNLDQLVGSLQGQALRRLVVAAGHDRCTIRAAAEAADKGRSYIGWTRSANKRDVPGIFYKF